MGIDTKARLIGHIEHDKIAEFVKSRFGYRIRTCINTNSYNYPTNLDIYADYTQTGRWDIKSGFIDLIVDDTGMGNRSIFYCKNNLNTLENYDYYEKHHPELVEMVKAETTFLSMRKDDFAIEVIGAIVDEFGGWFCEDDCGDKFYRVVGKREASPA